MNIRNFIKNPTGYFNKAIEIIVDKFHSKLYIGKIVTCQLCNWNGKRFFKGRCPKCRSLERTRLIPFSLNYFDLISEATELLHIAPNKSEFNFIENSYLNLIKYDRLNITANGYCNIIDDITDSNLKKNSYNLLICWHVLEHIEDDYKAIQEMYRILKFGGRLLLSIPIHPPFSKFTYESDDIKRQDYKKYHGHYDHCRSCGEDYYKRFEKAGFKTNELYVKKLDIESKLKYGLRDDHIVWCFEK